MAQGVNIGINLTLPDNISKEDVITAICEEINEYGMLRVDSVTFCDSKKELDDLAAENKINLIICMDRIGDDSIGGGAIKSWTLGRDNLKVIILLRTSDFFNPESNFDPKRKKILNLFYKYEYYDAIFFLSKRKNTESTGELVSKLFLQHRTKEEAYNYYEIKEMIDLLEKNGEDVSSLISEKEKIDIGDLFNIKLKEPKKKNVKAFMTKEEEQKEVLSDKVDKFLNYDSENKEQPKVEDSIEAKPKVEVKPVEKIKPKEEPVNNKKEDNAEKEVKEETKPSADNKNGCVIKDMLSDSLCVAYFDLPLSRTIKYHRLILINDGGKGEFDDEGMYKSKVTTTSAYVNYMIKDDVAILEIPNESGLVKEIINKKFQVLVM